jgi:WD40 repeat protein
MIVLPGERGEIAHLAFGPDGKLLAAINHPFGLEMWDVPARRKWGRYTSVTFHNAPTAFHPTEPFFFAYANSGIAVIDTGTKKVRVIALGWGLGPRVPTLAPDGASWVVGGGTGSEPEVLCYRLRPNATELPKPLWSVPVGRLTARSPHLWTSAIRIAPDGKTFALLSGENYGWDGTVKPQRVSLHSLARGEERGFARVPPSTICALDFAPDARTFVTCRTNILSLWQTGDLKARPRAVRSTSRQHFTGLAFHPSGRYLAATCNDATVKIYDTTTWDEVRAFTWEIGRMRSVCFSPDGALAAAGSDKGQVVVWDVDL